jgi:hypothetical protein
MSIESLMLDLGLDPDAGKFGMYSDAGEEAVYQLAVYARKFALCDKSINQMLWALAETEAFSEASDTVVRENVFAYVEGRME